MQVQKLADGRVEVHLEPPELGRVEIAFDFGEDGLRATLTSDRPGTADLVRRHADMLLQQLRAAGFENATLDLGGHTRQDRAPDHPRANALNDISIKTTGTNMSDPEQAVSQQRLDLRF
ncbi:MAG: flagellar hook-length control protein FliK [Pseudomonadota bacterium]